MSNERNEKYINMIIDLIDDFDDVNFIVSNEVAFEAVLRLELKGIRFNEEEPISFSDFKEMFNSDKLIISKSTFEDNVKYWFEDAYGNNGIKDMGFEECVSFVEDGILTENQIKRHIEGEVVVVTEDDEEETDLFSGIQKFKEDIKNEVIHHITELNILENNIQKPCIYCNGNQKQPIICFPENVICSLDGEFLELKSDECTIRNHLKYCPICGRKFKNNKKY